MAHPPSSSISMDEDTIDRRQFLAAAALVDEHRWDECLNEARANLTDPTLPLFWELKNMLLVAVLHEHWYAGQRVRHRIEKLYAATERRIDQDLHPGDMAALLSIRIDLEDLQRQLDEQAPETIDYHRAHFSDDEMDTDEAGESDGLDSDENMSDGGSHDRDGVERAVGFVNDPDIIREVPDSTHDFDFDNELVSGAAAVAPSAKEAEQPKCPALTGIETAVAPARIAANGVVSAVANAPVERRSQPVTHISSLRNAVAPAKPTTATGSVVVVMEDASSSMAHAAMQQKATIEVAAPVQSPTRPRHTPLGDTEKSLPPTLLPTSSRSSSSSAVPPSSIDVAQMLAQVAPLPS
nr:hypothetical protein B0A51_12900 [Rachicladosporium sp. CCFEE 5018]